MKPTAKPPLADTWAVNLPDVLLALVQGGTSQVVLELATEPDGNGNVRLLVRRCNCGLCQQSAPSALASPALETRDDLTPGHQ